MPIAPRCLPLRSSRLALVVGTLVLVGLFPGRVDAAEAATPGGPATPGVRPTVQYEEALAHAGDRISFEPGGRVTVPFRPRDSDRWTVDGGSPVVLPSGRVSGSTMRDAPTAVADRADEAVASDRVR